MRSRKEGEVEEEGEKKWEEEKNRRTGGEREIKNKEEKSSVLQVDPLQSMA